jgi:hypothetical protein
MAFILSRNALATGSTAAFILAFWASVSFMAAPTAWRTSGPFLPASLAALRALSRTFF